MAHTNVDGHGLTLHDIASVARDGTAVRLTDASRAEMARSRAWVDAVASDQRAIYGVNTGYGSLARVRLSAGDIRDLSLNLIQSHAAGLGAPVPEEVVRAMMLLRANALAKGASGCRPVLVQRILDLLNHRITPIVPSRGSCGSSGDLAPLAHLGLVLFGKDAETSGEAWLDGERMTGRDALARFGLDALTPLPKEGLAICNGAQLTTAYAALAVHDACLLAVDSEIAAAMSFEALRGTTRAFHPAVHALRPYKGAIATAANLLALVEGSSLSDSLPDKVQDAYSLRCVPQVHGAVRDGLGFVQQQVGIELNAATDNPLILVDAGGDNKAFSAGLFHGEPVGLAADHLRLVLCELSSITERRVYRLSTGTLSARMPPLLARRDRPGLGLMAPQTTAAALVAENRALAWPASADSIPTCEDQEDLVAMSTTAARRAYEVLQNTRRIVATELYAAARALRWRLDHEEGITLGRGTAVALEVVEAALPGTRAPGPALTAVEEAVRVGAVQDAVREVVSLEEAWLP